MAKKGKPWIGTSGWTYGNWRGRFYPEDLKQEDFLLHYAKFFNTTEVNYSFYHLPKVSTYEKWASKAPEGFVFAVKASQTITHRKRLEGAEDLWRTFIEHAEALGPKLGPILIQLPPSFRADPDRLERFLDSVPEARKHRLALECRHASWFDPLVLDRIRQLGVAAVIAQSERYPEAPHVPTADFVYLRFHGPGALFASRYSRSDLEPYASAINKWLAKGLDVYAYFNNDFHGFALENARMLQQMVGAPVTAKSRAGRKS